MSSVQPEEVNASNKMAKTAAKVQWCNTLQWVFVMAAFILMSVGAFSCNEIKFNSITGADGGGSLTLQFGSWRYQGWSLVSTSDGDLFTMESCFKYPDYIQLDPKWKAARAFSILTLTFAVSVVILNIASSCGDPDKSSKRWLEAPLLLLTTLCQGLSLLLLGSNACLDNQMVQNLSIVDSPLRDVTFQETCSIGTGTKCLITATVFYFLSAAFAFLGTKAEKAERQSEVESGLAEPLCIRLGCVQVAIVYGY